MYLETLKKNIFNSVEIKNKFLKEIDSNKTIENFYLEILEAYKNNGKLYVAGNGGSAADAQHLVAEFVSKFNIDRDPLPAEALTVDTSILTAIGNDYGFEKIFSRQIKAKMNSNDIFLGITTSGNSQNIIEALYQCKKLNITSLLLSGNNGGEAKKIADYSIVVPSNSTAIIQEIHILIYHSICECLENHFFSNK